MAVSKRLRYEVLRRDNHACRYCGAAAPDAKLHVDHVIPQSLGGPDHPTNLVTACTDCNAGKTSSMPGAATVADVDQDAFRQAVAGRKTQARELSEHLWRGGYPPQWGRPEIEGHAAEAAWLYAWSIASDGGHPSHDQYNEFLTHSASLFELKHSIGEIVCAAVHAGSQLTPHLSWGLGIAELRHVPISGEQCSRIHGVYDEWLRVWSARHGTKPTTQQANEFQGRLIVGAREGYSRDELMQGARSAAFAENADVDYFAYHIACDNAEQQEGSGV